MVGSMSWAGKMTAKRHGRRTVAARLATRIVHGPAPTLAKLEALARWAPPALMCRLMLHEFSLEGAFQVLVADPTILGFSPCL